MAPSMSFSRIVEHIAGFLNKPGSPELVEIGGFQSSGIASADIGNAKGFKYAYNLAIPLYLRLKIPAVCSISTADRKISIEFTELRMYELEIWMLNTISKDGRYFRIKLSEILSFQLDNLTLERVNYYRTMIRLSEFIED
ncbi:MAG TPA: hypothetical protein VKU79_03275 [Thermoplasmataceae archaeon]|nr:hypothetical protein [Thermoplasmataceae archaeon]